MWFGQTCGIYMHANCMSIYTFVFFIYAYAFSLKMNECYLWHLFSNTMDWNFHQLHLILSSFLKVHVFFLFVFVLFFVFVFVCFVFGGRRESRSGNKCFCDVYIPIDNIFRFPRKTSCICKTQCKHLENLTNEKKKNSQVLSASTSPAAVRYT